MCVCFCLCKRERERESAIITSEKVCILCETGTERICILSHLKQFVNIERERERVNKSHLMLFVHYERQRE